MKRKQIFFTVLLFAISLSAMAQEKIKIACVGNSITYGSGIAKREKNSYPAQLQTMLGNAYQVMNFGHSGATLLKNTKNPYWQTKAYQDALASAPNIVFIKLGTNDSKGENRDKYKEFENNYKELIASFRQLPTKPRIILLTPVTSFSTDTNGITDTILKTRIIPMIQNVAYTEKLELVNLHPLLIDKEGMFPDKIHPDGLGANVIAKRLYESVVQKTDQKFNIFQSIKSEKTFSNFNGFNCADFNFEGRKCKIVQPKVTAKGHPWVWRARFWGHQPQLDVSLLERGFHVVYCDVAELFGNAEAVELWNKYYDMLQKAGLSKKVALEGMSRGGVYVYNWALANPEKVACIYADAPVLDLKSWPGGKGKSAGSKGDWEIVKKDYQLTEEKANNFHNNPLDHASKIAKLGFPMLHVVGDVDDVVPIAENTTPFEKIVSENGGNIEVIHKPGVNHHPHSLQNPTPLTDFILNATEQKVNFAKIAATGSEYRDGAGWTKNKDWWAQREDIDSLLGAEPDLDIVFLGNSITQGTGGHRTYVTYKPGLKAFDSVFVNLKWECAGISGDRSQNILWRLQNGNYAKAKPKVMVVMIGVNNLIGGDTPKEIVEGINQVTDWTTKNMPSTKVLLLGPLPVGLKSDDKRRKKYEEIHRLLAKQPHQKFRYESIAKPFMLPNGDLDPIKYGSDGIHLLPQGYKAWAIALKPIVNEMLGKN